jgi:dimethylhistidine N-methyltransferase
MDSENGGGDLKDSFVQAVRAGLSKTDQKELPCSYLYDALGSALFQAITFLPEYGVTRAEARLLRRYAEGIAGLLPTVRNVVELGSGDGSKTRSLLEALAAGGPLSYFPIDVSQYALNCCERDLVDLPAVNVCPLRLSYLDGLRHPSLARSERKPALVLFLGSTIGNFHRSEALSFLRAVRDAMSTGDALLLGVDLDKPASVLLPAYDDPAGVTAAFNRNLLGHINRVLSADFDLASFVHEARFNEVERRIEMHLRSKTDQVVTIPAASMRVYIHRDETLWTESSYRYSPEELKRLALQAGFREIGVWIDEDWAFASTLWIAEKR